MYVTRIVTAYSSGEQEYFPRTFLCWINLWLGSCWLVDDRGAARHLGGAYGGDHPLACREVLGSGRDATSRLASCGSEYFLDGSQLVVPGTVKEWEGAVL